MIENDKHLEILEIVKEKLSCSAHNVDHVMRVYELCLKLARFEAGVNHDILVPAALLHDIARVIESNDKSGEIDHAVLGGEMAVEILKNLDYDDESINKIKHCIVAHRFRSGNKPESIEAKILYDADKLDVIGAVGIARTFMLAGQFGQSIGNTNVDDSNVSENGRLKDVSKHSPMKEFEYKFKKIPSRLFTSKGREMGEERIKVMEDYFNRLGIEITGEK